MMDQGQLWEHIPIAHPSDKALLDQIVIQVTTDCMQKAALVRATQLYPQEHQNDHLEKK